MKTIGNILWHFPFFGFVTAAFTWLLGALLTATVVAAPIGLGLMEYGKLLFWPFGNAMVSKSQLNVTQNKAWKTYSTVITVIYFPFGLFLTVCAIFQVVALCISIVGIPAAMVVAKSLSTYLNPVNKKCVPSAVVAELDRRKAQTEVEKHLGKQPGQQDQFTNQQQPSPIVSAAENAGTAQPLKEPAYAQPEANTNIPEVDWNEKLSGVKSFLVKYRTGLLAGVGILVAFIFVYNYFIKADPVKDGKSLAKTYCACTDELNKANLSSGQTFLTEFDGKKYKSRTEARNVLMSLYQINQTNYNSCTQQANIKYKEQYAEYNAKGGRNLYVFDQTYNSLIGACNTNNADGIALQSSIDIKINSIIDPEPDAEKIKADLIGNKIPGWSFDYLNEFQSCVIDNTTKGSDRIEYLVSLKLLGSNETLPHDAQVNVVYVQGPDGWYINEVKEIYITYIFTAPVDDWQKVVILEGCNYNRFDQGFKYYIQDPCSGQTNEQGPDVASVALHCNDIFIKSRESNPVNIIFKYFPTN